MDTRITKVEQLIDFFMGHLSDAADDEDWQEADGWIGRWVITGTHGVEKIYEVRGGRFWPLTTPQKTYAGEVEMTVDTFLDLVDSALHGKGEETFALKYAKRAIRYRGEQWIVDSERFRKILKRLGSAPIRRLL